MKNLLMALVSVVAVSATAQSKMTGSIYNSGAYHDVTPKLGFNQGAANFGVGYNLMNDGAGFGGYFHMQTEKKSNGTINVNQAMAFGGNFKINVIDSAHAVAYVAPGFGIAMIKEIGTATGGGTASDETTFGPSFSVGGQIKLPAGMAIGIERLAYANWFNDKVNGLEGAAYQVAFSLRF